MWGFLRSVFGVLDKALGWFTRREHRKAGANEERLDQWERADDAKKRMDAVEHPDPDNIVDRLRRGEF